MKKQTNKQNKTPPARFTRERCLTEPAIYLLTEAFALVGGAVDKDLGGDDVPERQEHLQYLRVGELLWQVIDEDVTAFRT